MSRGQLIALPMLLLLLSGCGKEEAHWHGRNITGVMPHLVFSLSNGSTHTVTAADYAGKVVLLYFGFTHCEDVCPATLTTLSTAVHRLGPEADKVRIVFVSVDPQRDTPYVLQHYASRFSPQVIALSGTNEQLDALTRRYRVAYSYGSRDAEGNYEVYHSSAIYVFDPQGQVRLLLDEKLGSAAIAEDLHRLINSSSWR